MGRIFTKVHHKRNKKFLMHKARAGFLKIPGRAYCATVVEPFPDRFSGFKELKKMDLQKHRWRMLVVDTGSAGADVGAAFRSGVHTHGSKNQYKRFITEYLPLSETLKRTIDGETWSGTWGARAIGKRETEISFRDVFPQCVIKASHYGMTLSHLRRIHPLVQQDEIPVLLFCN